MVLNVFPVVYFAVSRTMMSVGGRYASAARVCGAGKWQALWRVTLPLSTPGIAASLLLVFALTIEEFGTPATLGAQAGYRVLVTGIHQRFSDWPIDIPGAAVLSLLLVMLAMAAFSRPALAGERGVRLSARPASQRRGERAELGKWKWPTLVLFSAVAFISVAVPLLAVSGDSTDGNAVGRTYAG